jgi:hypothetical protein
VVVWIVAEEPTEGCLVSENPALTILIYPMAGEPFTLTTTDFDTEDRAVDELASAFGTGTVLRLTDRGEDAGDTTLVLNLTNIVAVRVLPRAGNGKTGQYL